MPKKRKAEEALEEMPTVESRMEDRKLYCVCRTPDNPDSFMVQCDFCSEWYHPSCINIDEEDVSDQAKWNCPACITIMAENPMISRKGLLGFQGRVAPSKGWTDDFPVDDVDERIVLNNVETKRHRTEGWTLFREGRVSSLSSNVLNNCIFFRSQCQAAMRQQNYTIYMCLKEGGQKLKWCTCSCPAGIDGQCKHAVATMYLIIDLHRQEISKIPDVKTCTDKLQMWHVRKPTTDEPLLFSDIAFVRHDPDKPAKRELCSSVKFHNPIPDFHSSVTKDDLNNLVKLYDAIGMNLPVLETISANNFAPVLPKQQMDADLHDELFHSMESDNTDTEIMTSQNTALYSAAVQVDLKKAMFIEKNTRMQSKSSFWFEQREYRLTSSTFGSFCKLKPSTDPYKAFMNKKKYFTTKSVRHGINYESQAFAKYKEKQLCQSCSVGLVLNPKFPFLAASPDGMVKVDGQLRLVEIKCPYSLFQRKTKLSEQIKDKRFYLQKCDGKIKLKESHDYFFQIQGQLNITNVDVCDLVVFVPPEDFVVVSIKKDVTFFNSVMLPKLQSLYFDRLLPRFVEELESVHV